jgi:hypothetical protein
MDQIDVRGLPEPVAQALQTMVQRLREQLPQNGEQAATERRKVCLPLWPGKVTGDLSREAIYGDAL